MNKILPFLAIFPLLIQTVNPGLQLTITQNATLVEQLAHLAPMGVNPYLTVFMTSICSKFGFHNAYVATNPFFNSWIVLVLFGILFFFTALVGTVFKTNKATATIGLIDTYLSNKAALVINAIVVLAPTFLSDNPVHDEVAYQAGIMSISFKTLLILGISLYFLIVVMTVKFFIDILIFLSPIPLIDTILEIIKIVIAAAFILISIVSPVASVVIAALMFLISLFFYRRAIKLIDKTTYLVVSPLLNFFKSKERKLSNGNHFSMIVLTNSKIGKLNKGIIVRLEEENDRVHLVRKRFLLPDITQDIDLTGFYFLQNHLDIVLSSENNDKSIILNSTYHRYLPELAEKFGIELRKKSQRSLNLNAGFLKRVRTLFTKKDIAELKSLTE